VSLRKADGQFGLFELVANVASRRWSSPPDGPVKVPTFAGPHFLTNYWICFNKDQLIHHPIKILIR
jgi:hypothetical protein